VAGAGDAVFGADVGDFHGCWVGYWGWDQAISFESNSQVKRD
jgi:hypothetical protein